MAYFKGAASEAARAEQLLKRRQKEAEATADRKRKIKDGMRVGEISTKFSANIDSLDRLICNDSVGLITLDEMKRRQEEIFRVRDQLLATGKYGDGCAVLDVAARLAFNNRSVSSAASSSAEPEVIHVEIPRAAVPKVEHSRLSFDPFAEEEDVEEASEVKTDQQEAHVSVTPQCSSDASGSAPSSLSPVAESSSAAAATPPVPAEAAAASASASSSSLNPAAPPPSEDSPIASELFAERKSLLRMRLERERSDYRAARPQSDAPVGDPLALGDTTPSVDAPSPSLSSAKGEPQESSEDEKQLTSATAPISTAFKKKKRLGMNPEVDTSFLPDVDRAEAENRLREQLRLEWVARQERIRMEDIEVTYSYWDGTGHRRSLRMKKGNTIGQFLAKALDSLRREFGELRSASAEQLMFIKEDVILPQHYTFHELIVMRARGKSGPLFSFDVHTDVRLVSDASLEKDETHAGKVCLRSWYERNKHIFPASRWEPFDPEKDYTREGRYTVADNLVPRNAVK